MANRISLDALTGLRFIAALCVLIHHAIGQFPEVKRLQLPLGNASVCFFFVLSGFILTYAYDGRLKTWSDVRAFWYTRWARIWPLHLVCWIYAISATSVGFLGLANNGELLAKSICQLFLVQSWIPAYPWAFTFNDVSWSISDEAFFYLIFPVLFLLSARRFAWVSSLWIAFILLTVGVTQVLLRLEWLPSWFDAVTFTHLNPAVRSYDFLLGMIAGRMFVSRAPRHDRLGFWSSTGLELLVIGCAVLVWWIALRNHPLYLINRSVYGGQVIRTFVIFSGLALNFAFVVYILGRSQGAVARLAGLPLMVYLGEISYSLYMCHALVIKTLKRAAPQTMAEGGLVVVLGLVFLISLIVSIFLYHLVELPAKAGLLALYRGEFRKALNEVRRLWWEFWVSLRGWLVTLIGVGLWFSVRTLS